MGTFGSAQFFKHNRLFVNTAAGPLPPLPSMLKIAIDKPLCLDSAMVAFMFHIYIYIYVPYTALSHKGD